MPFYGAIIHKIMSDCIRKTKEPLAVQIDEVNDMFAEARDIIEDARDDAETVYFNEAHSEAKEAVGKCLERWSSLIAGTATAKIHS